MSEIGREMTQAEAPYYEAKLNNGSTGSLIIRMDAYRRRQYRNNGWTLRKLTKSELSAMGK